MNEIENKIISITFSEADILKFNARCTEIYQNTNPDKIMYKSISVSNVATQRGLMSVFNLYLEVLTDLATFDKWKTDLKIKTQIIQ